MIRSTARRYSIRFNRPTTSTVTIERGGQKQDISLNIAQVAAEATKDLEGDSPAAARGAPIGAPPPGAIRAPNGPTSPNE